MGQRGNQKKMGVGEHVRVKERGSDGKGKQQMGSIKYIMPILSLSLSVKRTYCLQTHPHLRSHSRFHFHLSPRSRDSPWTQNPPAPPTRHDLPLPSPLPLPPLHPPAPTPRAP